MPVPRRERCGEHQIWPAKGAMRAPDTDIQSLSDKRHDPKSTICLSPSFLPCFGVQLWRCLNPIHTLQASTERVVAECETSVSGADAAHAWSDGACGGRVAGSAAGCCCGRRGSARQRRATTKGRPAGIDRRRACRRGHQASRSEARWTAGACVAQGSKNVGDPQGIAAERDSGRQARSRRTG